MHQSKLLGPIVFILAGLTTTLTSLQAPAEPPVHFLHGGVLVPGAIGSAQLLRGGPMQGYFQPVEIRGPKGSAISAAVDGQFLPSQNSKVLTAMLIGPVYRLRVTGIAQHEGEEVYPTIEVINRLYPPCGEELRFPVPVQLTQEDLVAALNGKFITRIVFVEDPRAAYARQEDPTTQYTYPARASEDPLVAADRLGRPIAIVRIGGRVPNDTAYPDDAFLYHSPPLLRFATAAALADNQPTHPGVAEASDSFNVHQAATAGRSAAKVVDTQFKTAQFNSGSAAGPELTPEFVPSDNDITGGITAPEAPFTPQPLSEPTIAPRIDQSQLGPGNRWSIYGVDPQYPPLPPAQNFSALPQEAYTGYPGDGYTQPGYVPRYMQESASEIELNEGGFSDPSVHDSTARTEIDGLCDQMPLDVKSCGPWKPPGISGPWPEDEYLFDGGDSDGQVKVRKDWSLVGLDSEDTIAHYDTLAGKTVVTPSCRVCIYSPRFAAVRQIILPYGDAQLVKAGGVDRPIGPKRQDEVLPVTTAIQPVQPVGEIGQRAPITFLDKAPPVDLYANTVIRATIDRLKPYENFDLIRRGLIQEDEKPFLAASIQSAIAWSLDQGIEVAIEGKKAVAIEGDQRAQATYSLTPPDHPCLRICKVASTPSARPGEIVEFTLRFDNVGDQTVGNVTIVDNLTTRLELVPGSGQCSQKAQFFTEPNKEGSLILRWEVTEPLKPGDGGIARFKCVVR